MKRFLFVPLILSCLFSFAQKKSSTFVLSYGSGNGSVAHYRKVDGSITTNKNKSLNIFGINYHESINKYFFIETGLAYINYKYTSTYHYPGTSETSTLNKLELINLPIKIRLEFAKFFFLNTGLLMDLNLDQMGSYNSGIKSGLGVTAGFGMQYYYKNKFGVTINPQANLHGLITGYGLMESNITFGLAYRIVKN